MHLWKTQIKDGNIFPIELLIKNIQYQMIKILCLVLDIIQTHENSLYDSYDAPRPGLRHLVGGIIPYHM